MADWKQPQAALPQAVGSLGPGSHLVILRRSPEVRLQFTVTPDGSGLRCEISRESAEDDPRLRERGWEMVDAWSGVWRRSLALPASSEQVAATIAESLVVVCGWWGNPRSDGFSYLAWQDLGERRWWEFWKPAGERPLKFPDLGLPQAAEPDPNS